MTLTVTQRGGRFDSGSRAGNPARVTPGTRLAAAWLTLAACLGCGGGGAARSCGQVQPCGGDLIGSWTVTDGCANPDVAASELATTLGVSCPGLTVQLDDAQSGLFTFTADMTFIASATTVGGIVTATIPASCLGGMSCAELQTFFGLEGLMVHGCTGSAACTCAIDRVPLTLDGPGTYLVTGTSLELRPDGAPAVLKQYCVQGSTLHLSGVSGPTIVEDLVLEKENVATP